jgi:hypothetical protein
VVAQCSGGLGWRVAGLQPLSHNVHNLSNAAEIVSVAMEALSSLPDDMTPPPSSAGAFYGTVQALAACTRPRSTVTSAQSMCMMQSRQQPYLLAAQALPDAYL